ncbi:MAG: transglycosylase SLT domain-containing protein [Terrimesophilobacter sp.]
MRSAPSGATVALSRTPLRRRYSLPGLAFAIAFIFILVYMIVPDPADAASAIEWAQAGNSEGQTLAIANGGSTADVVRDAYGVTKKVAPPPPPAAPTRKSGAPAAGTPNPGSAQAIAHGMVLARGWGEDQYSCLVALWNRESHWNVYAYNPSGAYGIPQALPGSKMASAGADWQTNPATQITWGLGYITGRYGTPCGAWAASQAKGWY